MKKHKETSLVEVGETIFLYKLADDGTIVEEKFIVSDVNETAIFLDNRTHCIAMHRLEQMSYMCLYTKMQRDAEEIKFTFKYHLTDMKEKLIRTHEKQLKKYDSLINQIKF